MLPNAAPAASLRPSAEQVTQFQKFDGAVARSQVAPELVEM
jgi:hypothetical protein